MIRFTLVLTLMLTFIGLPVALKPFLFQSEPRLVILNTDETPHVVNPHVTDRVTPVDAQPMEGPQLTLYRPFADELMAADS